jgi:NAD(P)-dependent dehydrogenase (short-subunit alcohol dehydrogenase family)
MNERVVLVTGALAGIGRATATAFAREGAAVVVSGRRDEDGKAFAAELTFLASDAARFVTGQIVGVNGGKTAA